MDFKQHNKFFSTCACIFVGGEVGWLKQYWLKPPWIGQEARWRQQTFSSNCPNNTNRAWSHGMRTLLWTTCGCRLRRLFACVRMRFTFLGVSLMNLLEVFRFCLCQSRSEQNYLICTAVLRSCFPLHVCFNWRSLPWCRFKIWQSNRK